MHVKHLELCLEQSMCSVRVSLVHYDYSIHRGCGSGEGGAISGEPKEGFPEKMMFEL